MSVGLILARSRGWSSLTVVPEKARPIPVSAAFQPAGRIFLPDSRGRCRLPTRIRLDNYLINIFPTFNWLHPGRTFRINSDTWRATVIFESGTLSHAFIECHSQSRGYTFNSWSETPFSSAPPRLRFLSSPSFPRLLLLSLLFLFLFLPPRFRTQAFYIFRFCLEIFRFCFRCCSRLLRFFLFLFSCCYVSTWYALILVCLYIMLVNVVFFFRYLC